MIGKKVLDKFTKPVRSHRELDGSIRFFGGFMKSKFLFTFFAVLLSFAQTHASVRVSDGTVSINVSGGDADSYGESGSSAGSVNVNLSYADAEKTIVKVTGVTSHWGREEKVDVTLPLKELKQVRISADGGSGAQGYSGSNGSSGWSGSDGSDGSNGSDGCPPSNGTDGTDGQNGTDGGPGGNGEAGGSGGRGGEVHVTASPDQTELLLFVKASVYGGSGGAGGSGGYGGSGGSGGRGGRGGQGGKSNCTDAEGKPVFGWDGSNGRDGRDGYSGSSGSSGYDGRDGYGGGSGKFGLDVGGQSYKSPFKLDVTAVKFVDDSGNEVLEPGERVHLTLLEVSNTGPMPSPQGQTIRLSFASSSTLLAPAPLTASLPEILPGSKRVVAFKKGMLTLVVPDNKDLIGKKAVATGALAINNVSLPDTVETGMSIGWPVTVTAVSSKYSGNFEVAGKPLVYNFKNVGTEDLGPNGDQPVYVRIGWSSKNIPASDVAITLADGRQFTLEKPVLLSDLVIPAKGVNALAMTMFVRDSALVNSASGNLTVNLQLQDRNSGTREIIQSANTSVYLELDVNAIEWNQRLSLASTQVQCQFPNLGLPAQPISVIQVAKAKGVNQLTIQLEVPGSAPSRVSPAIKVSAAKMLAYYNQFRGTWTAQNAVDFLNKLVSPNAPRDDWSFKSCSVGPLAPPTIPLNWN